MEQLGVEWKKNGCSLLLWFGTFFGLVLPWFTHTHTYRGTDQRSHLSLFHSFFRPFKMFFEHTEYLIIACYIIFFLPSHATICLSNHQGFRMHSKWAPIFAVCFSSFLEIKRRKTFLIHWADGLLEKVLRKNGARRFTHWLSNTNRSFRHFFSFSICVLCVRLFNLKLYPINESIFE